MPVIETRYAIALADLCEKTNTFDESLENFKNFMDLFEQNEELKFLLLSPGIKNTIKKETLKHFKGLNEKIQNLLFLLLDKNRIEFLPDVYTAFAKIAESKKEILHMTLTSASPLEATQVEKIKSIYLAKYNKKAAIAELIVDKSLLGGLKVQIGDTIIDASLKGRLEDLANVTHAKMKT